MDDSKHPPVEKGDEENESAKTRREVAREQEDEDFTPVIVKRNDEALRHPDEDVLEGADVVEPHAGAEQQQAGDQRARQPESPAGAVSGSLSGSIAAFFPASASAASSSAFFSACLASAFAFRSAVCVSTHGIANRARCADSFVP